MPTYRALPGFLREFDKLTPERQAAFMLAVSYFVADLRAGQLRRGLRVKKMMVPDDVWEMTWAPDGRATFTFEKSVREGERHVVWRRIGNHEILERP
jgi:hypothetical protein